VAKYVEDPDKERAGQDYGTPLHRPEIIDAQAKDRA
tara:strand:+ start:348 stop:455 length:108 start_codon:yes stop_codon:yes gene_type:complete